MSDIQNSLIINDSVDSDDSSDETVSESSSGSTTKTLINVFKTNIKTNEIPEIPDIINCVCGHMSSKNCIIKCCKECCNIAGCNKHNSDIKNINKSDKICTLCMKETDSNELCHYLNKKINTVVNYCEDCFNNNENKLMHMFKHKNVIKPKYEKDFKLFIKQFENTVITNAILCNDILSHDKFNTMSLMDSGYSYECPTCEDIIDIGYGDFCENCGDLVCEDNCTRHKHRTCSNKECAHNGCHTYCPDCYNSDNIEFHEKYQKVIMTSESINCDECDIDLNEFSEFVDDDEDYELKYLCPNCNQIKNFKNDSLRSCNNCDNYVCYDCTSVTEKYICNCDCDDDDHCENQDNCRNVSICMCNECDPNLKYNFKRSVSPGPYTLSENEADQCSVCMINKKKYASVPCGHLCLCGGCANQIKEKCPICNNKVTSIIKIF